MLYRKMIQCSFRSRRIQCTLARDIWTVTVSFWTNKRGLFVILYLTSSQFVTVRVVIHRFFFYGKWSDAYENSLQRVLSLCYAAADSQTSHWTIHEWYRTITHENIVWSRNTIPPVKNPSHRHGATCSKMNIHSRAIWFIFSTFIHNTSVLPHAQLCIPI